MTPARAAAKETAKQCNIVRFNSDTITNVASTECVNFITPEYFDSTFQYLYSIQLQRVKIASVFISCGTVFHNKYTRSTSLQVTTHSFNYNSSRWFK